MPPFIQRCDSGAVKIRMLLLYALNILDMVVTKFLIQTGKFREVNPVMALAMQNNWVVLLLKLIVPAILLVYLDGRLKYADMRHLKISARALDVLIAAYCVVSVLHLWLYIMSL